MDERATPVPSSGPVVPAPSERGWGKLFLALAAFLFLPTAMRALVPIDQATTLLVPAIAACALVGWWAGGRAFLAIAWVALASLLVWRGGPATPTAFENLARGWSLLLAGSFGLVCLFGPNRPLFGRSLVALGTTLLLATIMCLVGPMSLGDAAKIVADEFARRNVESMAALTRAIQMNASEWSAMTAKVPQLANMPAQMEGRLAEISRLGVAIFPALLALQSLAALALAWATYHRLGRARLGAPLRPLKEFRFNDQLVWGLIVGLTIMLLPTLKALHGAGKNLLVFFATLYAVRGFAVLAWFMAPGALGLTLTVGFAMLLLPILGVFAALALLMLGVAALALGLGDTWADWRSRARQT